LAVEGLIAPEDALDHEWLARTSNSIHGGDAMSVPKSQGKQNLGCPQCGLIARARHRPLFRHQ
jgi:hypothetical protein